jgi:hypothetical protein
MAFMETTTARNTHSNAKVVTKENMMTSSLPGHEWVMVDAQKARELLDATTFKNRGVTATRVAQYAQSMRDGRWRVTGEPLMMSPQGLINGQHRLLAIIESEMCFPMLVVTHSSADVYKVIDTGNSRDAGDLLSQHTGSYRAAAAIVRATMLMEARCISLKGGGSARLTNETIEARYLIDRAAFDAAVREACSMVKAIGGSTTAPGVAHFAFRNHTWIDDFFAGVRSGAGLALGAPALTLRNRVMSEGVSAKTHGKRLVVGSQMQVWFMALRARKAGRSLAKIIIGPDFWIPEEPTLRFTAKVVAS